MHYLLLLFFYRVTKVSQAVNTTFYAHRIIPLSTNGQFLIYKADQTILFTFQHILSGVATANQLAVISTGGLA